MDWRTVLGAVAPTADRFVRAVIDHLELKDSPRGRVKREELRGAGALAKKLGVERGTVNRWLLGERTPEYQPTMEMLESCGWLNMTEAEAAPTMATAGDRLEELVETVNEIATMQTEQEEILEVILGLLQGASERPVAAPSKRPSAPRRKASG